MNATNIDKDTSYHKMLAADFNELTTTIKTTNGKQTVLLVDTGAIYEYYEPTNRWYLQP